MKIHPIIISEPECVWDAKAVLGEGPVWDRRDNLLYWVDIKGKAIHRYSRSDGAHVSWTVEEMIGCLIPEETGEQFIAGLASGLARVSLEPGGGRARFAMLAVPEPDLPGNRFNDGKRAPDGSVWAGTMDDTETQATGSWWRLAPDGAIAQLDTGFMVTNGPAFDTRRGRVYLTDSARQEIYVAELAERGLSFDRRCLFLRFAKDEGYPDGMVVDRFGAIWVAFWDGGCLRRFDPDGELIQTVQMPVRRPTSLCFGACGGLYITSALIGPDRAGLDGGLFYCGVIAGEA